MTLSDAIQHAEEVAEENEKSQKAWQECKDRGNVGWSKHDIEAVDMSIASCSECAKENRQLAEWLRAYKTMDYNIRHLIDRYAEEIKNLEQDVEDEPMGRAAVNRNSTLGYYYRFMGELRGVLDMEDGDL